VQFHWSTDSGATDGMGTQWHFIRIYSKIPSTDTSQDGILRMWIDEQQLFTIDDLQKLAGAGGTNTTTSVRFFPSDQAGVPYEHYLDDVVIYSGYVPPPGGDRVAPAAPQNLRVM
jgi:hypothetical protein